MSYHQKQSPNKLYLFYPTSIIGFIITLVTRCPFAHAAIEVGGVLYDSSESRGNFSKSEIDLEKRPHLSFEFYGDLSDWLAHMNGRKYDWKGVLLWVFRHNHREKFYCFEAAWLALKIAGIVGGQQPRRLSGNDLMRIMAQHKASADPMLEYGVAAQILRAIGGEASESYLLSQQIKTGHQLSRAVLRSAETALGIDSAAALVEILKDKRKLLKVEEQLGLDNVSIRA